MDDQKVVWHGTRVTIKWARGWHTIQPKAQQKEKMKAPNMKTSNYDNNTSSVTYPLPKHSPEEGYLQIHTVVL